MDKVVEVIDQEELNRMKEALVEANERIAELEWQRDFLINIVRGDEV